MPVRPGGPGRARDGTFDETRFCQLARGERVGLLQQSFLNSSGGPNEPWHCMKGSTKCSCTPDLCLGFMGNCVILVCLHERSTARSTVLQKRTASRPPLCTFFRSAICFSAPVTSPAESKRLGARAEGSPRTRRRRLRQEREVWRPDLQESALERLGFVHTRTLTC